MIKTFTGLRAIHNAKVWLDKLKELITVESATYKIYGKWIYFGQGMESLKNFDGLSGDFLESITENYTLKDEIGFQVLPCFEYAEGSYLELHVRTKDE